MFNLIIKNGTIIDGTGKPRFFSDIAVNNGKIAEVGDLQEAKGEKTIDARGKVVCPGFIDVHSHADLTIIREDHEEILAPLVKQGITTFVGGNCGMAFAPLGNKNSKGVKDYIEAFSAKDFDDTIEWNTTHELYDTYEKRGLLLNMAMLAPHGIMRIEACGLETRLASKGEIQEMKKLVEEAMEAGAIGLSTGLQYFPGSQSNTDEIVELSKVVKKYDGVFTSHLRSYSGNTVFNAVNEVVEIAGKADIPGQISHIFAVPDFGPLGKPIRKAVKFLAWFSDNVFVPPLPLDLTHKKIGKILEKSKSRGINVGVDLLPDTTGFTHILAFFPPWVLTGGREDILKRLEDRSQRRRIKHDIETGKLIWPHRESNTWSMNFFKQMGWENVNIMSVTTEKNKRFEGHNVEEISKDLKKDPIDVCCDMLLEENGRVLVFESMAPPGDRLTERSMFFSLKDENTSICTDAVLLGVGTPSHIFHSCYPRYLGRYSRDMGLVDLESAIYKCTLLPAQQIGIKDRGKIAPGFGADLVIFDAQKIGSDACFKQPDLDPNGIDKVFINGNEVVNNNCVAEGKTGKLLRHGKA